MEKVFISLLCLLLFSCVNRNLADWPSSIPQRQLFVEAYAADLGNQQRQSQQEYLQWIMSFYQGNLVYQSGWLDIEMIVLAAVDSEARDQLDLRLQDLGAAIASEWAKHNEIRLIDSRMLGLWGSVLQLVTNFEQQKRSIEIISEDVDALLSGSLRDSDIQEPRYERLLQIELFGGF